MGPLLGGHLPITENILWLVCSSVTVDFAVKQVDFQITYPDWQVELLEKYYYLFTVTSWFSSGQVKFRVSNLLFWMDKLV